MNISIEELEKNTRELIEDLEIEEFIPFKGDTVKGPTIPSSFDLGECIPHAQDLREINEFLTENEQQKIVAYLSLAVSMVRSGYLESMDLLVVREDKEDVNKEDALLYYSFILSQEFKVYLDVITYNKGEEVLFLIIIGTLLSWFTTRSVIRAELYSRTRISERNILKAIINEDQEVFTQLNQTKLIMESLNDWNGKSKKIVEYYKFKGFSIEQYNHLYLRGSGSFTKVMEVFESLIKMKRDKSAEVILNLFFTSLSLDMVYQGYC